MTKKEKQFPISTRLSESVYDRVRNLCKITKKSVASITEDALNEYMAQAYNESYEPSHALQIDQYAVSLEKGNKKDPNLEELKQNIKKRVEEKKAELQKLEEAE